MIYVALLRGINVGGNSKVEMKKLKTVFEELGLENVRTYINSGNVIFQDGKHTPHQLVAMIEKGILKEFALDIKVMVRDRNNLLTVEKALPKTWLNNDQMKCDVMFLWEDVDTPEVLSQLITKEGKDDVKYVPGAILWRVDRKDVTTSGMLKLVGTPLYKKMTIRNCNTLRKLVSLIETAENER